jgi:hypothetical protein
LLAIFRVTNILTGDILGKTGFFKLNYMRIWIGLILHSVILTVPLSEAICDHILGNIIPITPVICKLVWRCRKARPQTSVCNLNCFAISTAKLNTMRLVTMLDEVEVLFSSTVLN